MRKYRPDWEDFCKRTAGERKLTIEDREKQLAAHVDDLKALSTRAAILGTIAAAALAANIFLMKDGNPSLMWMVKAAFVPLVLNFALLLITVAPSFSSIYKRYPSASDWQKLMRGAQARYTRLMMLVDRYSQRVDWLKAYQIRATVLLIMGGIPMGIALVSR